MLLSFSFVLFHVFTVLWYDLFLRNQILGVYCLPNVRVSQPFVPVNPSYLFMRGV